MIGVLRLYKKGMTSQIVSSNNRDNNGGISVNKGLPFQIATYKLFIWQSSMTSADEPEGYTRVNDLFEIINSSTLVSEGDYKSVRDCMKQVVEERGYDNLSLEEKLLVSQHNIGNGYQISIAIPNDNERDDISYRYNERLEAIRKERAKYVKSMTFSRCKNLQVNLPDGQGGTISVNAPEYIYGKLNVSNPTPPIEMSGNLLELFKEAGVQGFAGGDLTLGIYDFLLETAGLRFAPDNGGGITSDTNLLNNTEDIGDSNISPLPKGHSSWLEFSISLFNLIHYGIWE